MIKECCICGGAVETKKVLPFRDLIGTGVEIWNMHIGICPKCGLIFNQTPLTAAQLESRYKKNSRYEFDSNSYILGGNPHYKARCLRQKHFIDEQLADQTGGGGTTASSKSARRPAAI